MSLKTILAKLIDESTNSGEARRQVLGGGLTVKVHVMNGTLHLNLSRWRVWPSLDEWRTVVRDANGPTGMLPRDSFTDKGAYTMAGHWDMQPSLFEVEK